MKDKKPYASPQNKNTNNYLDIDPEILRAFKIVQVTYVYINRYSSLDRLYGIKTLCPAEQLFSSIFECELTVFIR